MKKKRNRIYTLLLLCLSILLGLGISEVIVRIVKPQQLILIRPDVYCSDSLTGWKHCPNVETIINSGEGPVRFRTDHNGYRINPRHLPVSPEIRILFVGDSFVEAYQVNDEETTPEVMVSLLEKKYNISVYSCNTGVGDWNPNQYLIQASKELAKRKYDLGIVFLYMGNDIISKKTTVFPPRRSRIHHFNIPRKLTKEEIKESILYPINDFLRSRSHLFILSKKTLASYLMRIGLSGYAIKPVFFKKYSKSDSWEVTASICNDIAEEFRRCKIPLVFVFIPTDYQVDRSIFEKFLKTSQISRDLLNLDQPNVLLRVYMEKHGLDVIDPLEEMRAINSQGQILYGKIDNHLNRLGYSTLAYIIFPAIEHKLSWKLDKHLSNVVKNEGTYIRDVTP